MIWPWTQLWRPAGDHDGRNARRRRGTEPEQRQHQRQHQRQQQRRQHQQLAVVCHDQAIPAIPQPCGGSSNSGGATPGAVEGTDGDAPQVGGLRAGATLEVSLGRDSSLYLAHPLVDSPTYVEPFPRRRDDDDDEGTEEAGDEKLWSDWATMGPTTGDGEKQSCCYRCWCCRWLAHLLASMLQDKARAACLSLFPVPVNLSHITQHLHLLLSFAICC